MNAADAVRLFLAGVLLFAAASKARGGIDQFAKALDRFAILPTGRDRTAAAMLIACEAIAGLLLLSPWYRIGAALGVFLTLGFAYAVSTALARGEIFPCGCFGPSARVAVSPLLLAFDLVLLGSALFLAGGDVVSDRGTPWQKLVISVTASLMLGGGLQAARVAFFPDLPAGLPEGSPAPAALVTCASGVRRRIDHLAARGAVLVFVSLECAACVRLLGALSARDERTVPILVITPDLAQVLVEHYACDPSWTCGGANSRELRRRFRIPGYPAAVALGAQSVLGTAFPANPDAIVEATARVVRALHPQNAPVPLDTSHRLHS